MTVIEQLKQEAEFLTEPLAQEVLDFLLFLYALDAEQSGLRVFLSTLRADGKGSHLNVLLKAIRKNVWSWNNVAA